MLVSTFLKGLEKNIAFLKISNKNGDHGGSPLRDHDLQDLFKL